MEYLSKERYDEIVAEINFLINEEYPRIKDALAEARAQGDLSENFEYRAARRAQAKAISRIRFLQKVLDYSRIIDTKALPKDRISLLSKVEFTELATNVRMTYTVVSPHEMDLQNGKISCQIADRHGTDGQEARGNRRGQCPVRYLPGEDRENNNRINMRLVIQRVKEASVSIGGEVVSSIGKGLFILVGVENGDTEADMEWLAQKTVGMRIFDDENGVMNST